MDFYLAVEKLSPKIRQLVKTLNDSGVSPELRKKAIAAAFQRIGVAVYGKAYHMTAWDMQIAETVGLGIDPQIAVGLGEKVSDSIANGDAESAVAKSKSFMLNSVGAAMAHASSTAQGLGEYQTLQIILRGKGDCDWCRIKAGRGKIVNPTPDDFRRHTHCDCFYDAQGYRSRNGEVKNYRRDSVDK